MENKFKKIALIGRASTEGVVATLRLLVNYLQSRQIIVILDKTTSILLPEQQNKLAVVDRDDLATNCDLIIVVGGDGSLLAAAHIAVEQHIPVLGVNRGNLGFLTDIHPDEIETIGEILDGNYFEEERFLIKAEIHQGQNIIGKDVALNDVVLLPSENNRMIEFSIYINRQFVCTHRADGMIIATPTGSTAHALSGGGPILHPNLDAMVLVPMFPHNLSSRPIVIKGNSELEIILAEHCNACPNISCDGQKLVPIPSGGKISIKKYPHPLRLIHLTHYNYYETLRVKLNWENKC